MLQELRKNVRSVSDQENVTVQHIVIDSCSTDGTDEWLRQNIALTSIVEKDNGMYEALNKGLAQASGCFLGFLNSDEQYLPGALRKVKRTFESHPDADIVYGDMLVISSDGSLIAYKKSHNLKRVYIRATSLYVPTCTMFVRNQLVSKGLRFRTDFRAVSDTDFVVRLIEAGGRAVHLKEFISTFESTGKNLSWSILGKNELRELRESNPLSLKLFRWPIAFANLVEKFLSGAFVFEPPIVYSVYTSGSQNRVSFSLTDASFSIHRKNSAIRITRFLRKFM